MGLAMERHFTNDHRVLNRATWSALHGSRILLGLTDHVLGPQERNDRLRGGRHGGTSARPQAQRQRLLS